MFDPLETIKPRVRALRAYTLAPDRATIKINQNENPWDAPARIKEESLRRLQSREWSRYPDFVPASLHQHLAQFANWRTDGVLAGNGSNELIQALLMVTVGEGKRVLISEPTFALYRQVTTVLGGEVVSVPLAPQLTYDAAAIRQAIAAHQPHVIILCSPNNPTGCRLDDDDLVEILKATPGVVAIDEAYFEFAEHSVVPLLAEHANLVVLRTFSKAMAMAAVRVGYLLGSPSLVREIGKALLPYNLNAISQTIAEVAIEMYEAELRPLVRRIGAERDRLFRSLGAIKGLDPVPTAANFMVVRVARDPKHVFAELLQRDILVRDVSHYPMLENCLRISVGKPHENDLLIDALRDVFHE
ncbi:MAG: histidinol-phosphate transaminase [Pyrinomonadaceae bacterium]